MTPSKLKALYERNEEGAALFFTHDTMRFFGDTMKNYGVRKICVVEKWDKNEFEPFEAWELYRKKPVKHGQKRSAYFALDGKLLIGVKPLEEF